jgi:hypothetical protein
MSAALNIIVVTSDLCEREFIRARMADFIMPVRLDFDVPGQFFRWSYISLHSHSVM